MALRSQQEIYKAFIVELQNQRPDLSDVEQGSIIDVLAGVVSVAVNEVTQVAVDEFRKTYFETANGPEVTNGPDELQRLAVDHFGDAFSRPGESKATGTVTFSRPNASAGNVTIPAGTIVKTLTNAQGSTQRYETVFNEVMTGTSIQASVRAVVAGTAGNAAPGVVTRIESVLSDASIVVTNAASFTGGKAAQGDSEYRETIRLLLQALKGATLEAIKAKALTVSGVVFATPIEFLQSAIEWNPATNSPVGSYFNLPRVKVYIADANGTGSAVLVQDVADAVRSVRASGVRIEIIAANAISQDWFASIALNSAGPNFATLETDTTLLKDAMRAYIQSLDIGKPFIRAVARKHILDLFGPSGTNDLINFSISTPTGDVVVAASDKLIPGTMSII